MSICAKVDSRGRVGAGCSRLITMESFHYHRVIGYRLNYTSALVGAFNRSRSPVSAASPHVLRQEEWVEANVPCGSHCSDTFLNSTVQAFLRHTSTIIIRIYPANRKLQSLHPSCWGNGSPTLAWTVSGNITALWLVHALIVVLTSQKTSSGVQ